MANEIDERIVEAKFDGAQFEKGVDKTLKKLNELKESLNLKDSGKNITEFAKEANEGIEKAGNALERLQTRFTTFTGMFKQQILGALASEVSGAILKIEQSIKNLVTSLSSQQIAAGMNKYNEIMTAVRTMTAAGIQEGAAYKAIDRLREYSDQTSYSLSQMTSGMSRLVAAGMKLEDAEKSMEGLANMAASAGVSIYEAERAFVNFSQAYSSGSMQIRDWVSFENLNMATQPVMRIFMQAAEEVGNLTKSVNKNGEEVYKTTNKINKKVKANKEVSINAFRDSLSFNWLDKQVMERATSVLSYFEDLGVDLSELSDEDLKTFAAKAFAAAKEARSFADVMGTLKDVVATGWATSFEIIFGKLEQAKNFFTWLTESNFAEIIYSIGEFRNAVLTAWGKDFDGTEDGGIFQKGKTGRDFLLASLKNIDSAIGRIHEGLQSFGVVEYNETLGRYLTFPEILGKNLGILSKRFNKFSVSFYNDVNDMVTKLLEMYTQEQEVNGETIRVLKPEYKEKLQKITDGISAVSGVISKLAGILNKTVGKVFLALLPIFESVGTAIGYALEPIVDLNNNTDFFQNITNAIDNLLIVLQPAIDLLRPVIELAGKLAGVFIDIGIQTIATNIELLADGLGLIIELFGGESAQKANNGVGIIESWGQDIQAFGESCKEGLGAVKDFFTIVFDNIRNIFGLSEEVDGEKGGLFKGLQEFFSANAFVKKVKTSAKKLWNAIDEFFFGKKVGITKFDGKQWYSTTERMKTGFSLWLSQLPKKIGDWFASVPEKAKALWSVVDDFLFGKKVITYTKMPDGQTKEITSRVKTGFSKWLEDTIASVREWIVSIPSKISDLWHTIINTIFGKELEATSNSSQKEGNVNKEKTEQVKTGFSKWLEDTIASVREWIVSIPSKISDLWHTIINTIFGKELEATSNSSQKEGNVNKEKTEQVKTGFSKWLEDTITSVREWIVSIPSKISDLWHTIINTIFGKELEATSNSSQKEGNVNKEKTEQVKTGFSKWLEDTITSVREWIVSIPSKISTLWTDILDAIFGKTEASESADKTSEEKRKSIVDIADENLKSIGFDIGALFANLPTYIANGITNKIDLLKDLFEHVKSYFAKRNKAREEGKEVSNLVNEDVETVAKQLKDDAEVESPLMTALLSIGGSIGGLITQTIPGMLSEAFIWVGGEAAGWFESLQNILNVEEHGFSFDPIDEAAKNIGTTISTIIKGIPTIIRTAVSSLSTIFKGKSPFEEAQEEITKAFTSPDGRIINEQAYQQAIDHARKSLSDTPGESGLFTSIKEIGKSIGEAFVDLGPDILNGINKAFTWIGEQVTNFTQKLNERDKSQGFFEWISNMVGSGDEQESQLATAIRSVGETIKNIITKVIPEFLGAAFAEVAVGVPKFIQSLFGGKEDAQTIEDGAEEFGANVVKSLQEGFQSTLSQNAGQGIGGSWIETVFGSLFGISSANAEEFDYQIDKAEEAQEKEKDLITRETEIQNEIDALLKEQEKDNDRKNDLAKPNMTPKEMEEFAAIEKEMDKRSKRFKELNAELEEIQKQGGDGSSRSFDTTEEKFEGFFGVLKQIGSFMTSEGGMVIGGMLALGFVLSQIKDFFSIGDEFEDLGYSAMMEAVKVAVIGLVGILGWITYLSSQTDANSETGRLQTTMNTLNRLVSFIERIGAIVVEVAHLDIWSTLFESGGKIADAFSSVKGAGEAGKTSFWGTTLGNILGELIKFGTIAWGGEDIGKGLRGGLNYLWDSIVTLFTDVGAAVENAVSTIAPAIDQLAAMDTQLDLAISAITKTMELLGKFRDLVEGKGNEIYEGDVDDTVSLVEFQTDYVNKVMRAFYYLGGGIHSFATGLNSFGDVSGAQAKMGEIAKLFGSNEFKDIIQNLVITLSKITLPSNSDFFISVASLLSSAMSVFTEGFGDLDLEKFNNVQRLFELIGQLAEKGKSGNLMELGSGMQRLGINLKSFITNISGIKQLVDNGTSYDDLTTISNLCIDVVQGLAKAVPDLVSIGDGSIFIEFGDSLGMFAAGVSGFINAINKDLDANIDTNRIQIIKDAITAVASMMSGVGELMGHFTSASEIPDFFSMFFKGVGENMVGPNSPFMIGLAKGQELDSGLAEGIKAGKAIAATEEVVANITSILDVLKSLGLNDDDTSPTITPVVDFTDLDEAKKRLDLLNQNGGVFNFKTGGLNDFANSANPNAYSATPDYTGILNSIEASLSNLRGPTTVKTALNGVRVQMDTGALVGALIGEIDMRLGRLGAYSEREQ